MSISIASERVDIDLPTGLLSLTVEEGVEKLLEYCDFAARKNPKRGFLFVSKVLGRHIPCRPSKMRQLWRQLAMKIPADIEGPILFIGMAETATALGAGVFEEYIALTSREDLTYFSTTRHRQNESCYMIFSETHSHATEHIVHRSDDMEVSNILQNAKSVIYIDDEMSTGNTFRNMVQQIKGGNQDLNNAVAITIADWRKEKLLTQEKNNLTFKSYSLLHGNYEFKANEMLAKLRMPQSSSRKKGAYDLRSVIGDRIGRLTQMAVDNSLIDKIEAKAQGARKLLFLGTGEFVFYPALVAEKLEERGFDIWTQGTTRSPIMPGMAIQETLVMPDNYGDGIRHYIYNVFPEDYDRIFICYETPRGSEQPDLLKLLNATPLFLGD